MGIFDKFKKDGTKLVANYKPASNGSLSIKGSAIEYKTGEIQGYSDGKGSLTGGDSINALISKPTSILHKEASTNETPKKVKDVLNPSSYTQKYHHTALNGKTPESSTIDEGSSAKFIAPSSPSVQGKDINTKAYSTAYSSAKTYKSTFDSYKTIDPSIASKF
jgi:hypothetical protein